MEVTQIAGIDSMSIFNYNNKIYYFFGDIHNQKNSSCDFKNNCDYFNYTFDKVHTYNTSCTTIGPLLFMWFLYNNDKNIRTDFYIEAPFTKNNTKNVTYFEEIVEERKKQEKVNTLTTIFPVSNISWLQLMYYLFMSLSCLSKNKQECLFYPNIHIHYSDIRIVDDKYNSPFYLDFLYSYIKDYIHLDLNQLKEDVVTIIRLILEDYKILFNSLFTTDYNLNLLKNNSIVTPKLKTIFNNYIDDIDSLTVSRNNIKIHRIAAELQKLKNVNTTIYNKLIEYINDYNYQFKDISNQLFYNYDLQNNNKKLKLLNDYLDYYYLDLSNMRVLMMDVYLLARMFTQQESTEIVSYVGQYHHVNYVYFFTHYLKANLIYKSFDLLPGLKSSKYLNSTGCVTFNNLPTYLPISKYRYYYNYNYK